MAPKNGRVTSCIPTFWMFIISIYEIELQTKDGNGAKVLDSLGALHYP